MPEADAPSQNASIAGPGKITIALRSRLGPLARLHSLSLPPKRLAFVNTGPAPVTVTHLSVDPLQEEQRGAGLRLDIAGPVVVAAGTPLIITLSGTVPGRPGTYLSTVRMHPDTGPAVTVPVQLTVAASSAWGVGLTVLGLWVVSGLTGLDGQGAVATKRSEALHKRGEAQIFVAAYPEPEGGHNVPAMERAYEDAITALSRPRSAGLLDHRLEDAAGPLAEADGLAAKLRDAAAKLSPADALIATADIPWKVLQPQLQALAGAPAGPATAGSAAPFASNLDAVLLQMRERLVGAPSRWLDQELAAQMTRLRLIATAGETATARAQAKAVQTAIRRAAHSLAAGQGIVMRQRSQMGFLLGTVADIQQGMADPDLAAPARADIAARLDAAQALLADGTDVRRMVDVNRTVNAAETALAAAMAQVELARLKAAVAAGSAETAMPEVEQGFAALQADPDQSPTARKGHLLAVLAAWRSMIARASDASARPALLTRLDAVAAALDRGDMPGLGTTYRELTAAWADYGVQRITAAGARALKPYCDADAARLQRRLGFIDQELQWEESTGRSTEWDRRRDRLRLALQRVPPDADCLKALLVLGKDTLDLSAEINSAAADTAGIDAAVRLEAMAVYGVSAATGPRALTPTLDPPEAELLVDRRLRIVVRDLDDAWKNGTMLSVDFGDRSPRLTIDAEKLRRDGVEHVYTRPLSAHVTVQAADSFAPDGTAVGALLGDGSTTFLIAPAPDNQARLLADRFLSARFGLALIVALVLYSWRFQARDRVFGARSFDYAEAFILGFTVNAAVTGLPGALEKLVPG